MRLSVPIRFFIFGLAALVVISVVTAFAAGITVSPANVGQDSESVTVDDFKPSECAGLSLTHMVSGSGTLTGTSGNDLILGSSGADVIDGLGGDDCILGGGGDDALTGNDGTDICLGGPGDDVFTACEGESQ
ncbi:MAG: calcium-binding protein [Chloroflexota bacterium]